MPKFMPIPTPKEIAKFFPLLYFFSSLRFFSNKTALNPAPIPIMLFKKFAPADLRLKDSMSFSFISFHGLFIPAKAEEKAA